LLSRSIGADASRVRLIEIERRNAKQTDAAFVALLRAAG
jgi:hypothetical protein